MDSFEKGGVRKSDLHLLYLPPCGNLPRRGEGGEKKGVKEPTNILSIIIPSLLLKGEEEGRRPFLKGTEGKNNLRGK